MSRGQRPAGDPSLLVVNSEAVSEWIAKGEVVPRYLNPGNVFAHIDLLLTNDDRPDPDALRVMAGEASIQVHNLPTAPKLLTRTLGYRPRLLRGWTDRAVELARDLRPSLVRCYGANLNLAAAIEIRRELGVPVAVSLHINPDVDVRARRMSPADRVRAHAAKSLERRGLRAADLVLPVYEPIVSFLERIGIERYEVAYNMLNGENLARKTDYSSTPPFKIISVGRQIAEKRPADLIRAVAQLPQTQLTVVGDGPDHELLQELAMSCGAGDRVVFERSVSNDELCRRLQHVDLFATHSDYFELSKVVLEAFVTGLPVLLNRRRGEPVPELTPEICMLVESSVDGYRAGLERLIAQPELRERLGRAAAARADQQWSPQATEARFAAIYRDLLERGSIQPKAHS